jgi:hypothetical protein
MSNMWKVKLGFKSRNSVWITKLMKVVLADHVIKNGFKLLNGDEGERGQAYTFHKIGSPYIYFSSLPCFFMGSN